MSEPRQNIPMMRTASGGGAARDGNGIVREQSPARSRSDRSTFGIFDAFPDEAGRSAHLSGRVAAALGEKASELLAKPPTIERVDVLAVKLSQ
jgi:hypothetical protein